MKIGVLGTGVVGETIANALIKKDHLVRMGSRTADNEKALAWMKQGNENASVGNFEDAASFGEIVFLCLNGAYALDAIDLAHADSLRNKIVVDLTNPLDFSQGMPPRLIQNLADSTSLGEEIQKKLPDALVVKTLNTINCEVMVKPKLVNSGDHSLFICGNDINAKNQVKHFLVDEFGWKANNIIDLGNIEAARTMEAYVPFWVSMMQALGTAKFNIKVVK